MNFQVSTIRAASTALFFVLLSISAAAQTPTRPTVASREMRVAERNNLYCAGYVQTAPVDTSRQIVGAVEEQEQYLYSENNFVYISGGANRGVQVGDLMTVFRPRGEVSTRWSRKDDLGFFVQEVGALEVIRVKPEVSVARVKTSCDNLLLGDLVQPMQVRVAPVYSQRPALNLFADPTGKQVGRLFMARDNQETLARDQIVYIDLGAEDNVRIGDYLTVFRPLGKGGLVSNQNESVAARSDGFQSDEYRGGRFSNQAPRKSGGTAGGRIVTTKRAKKDRPAGLRKVVGELVILNVKERTATAVITRNAQEIHTGDYVEVQ